jgi:hypothetical protein
MNSDTSQIDMQFVQLVLSLQTGAMVQMGKIASPVTGKVERELNQARGTIDLLEMLSKKTRGNLVAEEQTLLDRVLYELRLNFVDEAAKGDTPPAPDGVNSGPTVVDNKDT